MHWLQSNFGQLAPGPDPRQDRRPARADLTRPPWPRPWS